MDHHRLGHRRPSPVGATVRIKVIVLLCCVMAATPAAAATIPITLRTTATAPLGDATVTFGVPLAQGVWRDGTPVAVVDGERTAAVQTRVLSRWPDKSARWLLCDWQSSVAARGSRRARLEVGTSVASTGATLKVEAKADRIDVDTGTRRFTVPASGRSLLSTVEPEGTDPAELHAFAVVDGDRFAGADKRRIEVLESGPWRARVRVRGTYGSFPYELRIDFFAGLAAVRVFHSFANHGAAASASLDELGLTLTSPVVATTYTMGSVAGEPMQGPVPAAGVSIVQSDADTLRNGKQQRRGRASGWFRAGTETRQNAVAARFFWQEYPQGARFEEKALTYLLRAPSGRSLPVGSGAAKTHEMWLLLGGTRAEAEGLAARVGGVAAVADAEHIVGTGALRNSLAPAAQTKSFLDRLADSIARYEVAQTREEWDDSGTIACSADTSNRRIGAYGMLNWGDWNFRGYRDDIKGCDAWGNLEYDTAQVLALAYAATGNPQYLETLTAAARHFADVDRIHYSAQHPAWVGMNHPKNPLHFSYELGGIDLGHTWNEGLFTYALLTGDERAFTAAREIADYLERRSSSGVGFRGNPRQWGWPQIALVAAWENTGDPRYRDAALWYAERGILAHAQPNPRDWKAGILAEGLAYTHSATGDPKLRAWLEAYAAAILEARPEDPRFYPALAYVNEIAPNERLQLAARGAVDRLGFGRWGKPLTIAGRIGFTTLYWLSGDGDSPRLP